MADNDQDYAAYVANLRQSRKAAEREERLANIHGEHEGYRQLRDQAEREGNAEDRDWADAECERLEVEYQDLVGPQPDPRAVQWDARNREWQQRYGENAKRVLRIAHNIIMSPKTDGGIGHGLRPEQVNSPEYLQRLEGLLELYGKDGGAPYTPNNSSLTANEACKMSGLSAKEYNAQVKVVQEKKRRGEIR